MESIYRSVSRTSFGRRSEVLTVTLPFSFSGKLREEGLRFWPGEIRFNAIALAIDVTLSYVVAATLVTL